MVVTADMFSKVCCFATATAYCLHLLMPTCATRAATLQNAAYTSGLKLL